MTDALDHAARTRIAVYLFEAAKRADGDIQLTRAEREYFLEMLPDDVLPDDLVEERARRMAAEEADRSKTTAREATEARTRVAGSRDRCS